MSHSKLLQRVFGVVLIILLATSCGFLPVTSAPETPAPTSTLEPPTATSTPELLTLQLGHTFVVDTYEVKLIQVEERPTIIAFTGDEVGIVNTKQDGNAWIILTIEITNSGGEALPLTFSPSSTVILQANDQAGLSSVGVAAPGDNAVVLGLMNEQKLVKAFIGSGASGHIFVLPGGFINLLLAGGERNIIGNPQGPQWDLGKLLPDGTTQISLLFEVPTDATALTWKFLDSAPARLPEPQSKSLSVERGPTFTLGLTDRELCQIAEQLELECP